MDTKKVLEYSNLPDDELIETYNALVSRFQSVEKRQEESSNNENLHDIADDIAESQQIVLYLWLTRQPVDVQWRYLVTDNRNEDMVMMANPDCIVQVSAAKIDEIEDFKRLGFDVVSPDLIPEDEDYITGMIESFYG